MNGDDMVRSPSLTGPNSRKAFPVSRSSTAAWLAALAAGLENVSVNRPWVSRCDQISDINVSLLVLAAIANGTLA